MEVLIEAAQSQAAAITRHGQTIFVFPGVTPPIRGKRRLKDKP